MENKNITKIMINSRIEYYKNKFIGLRRDYELDVYDQEVKFELINLLEEIRHEFHISSLTSQHEEYRKTIPEIMHVYDGLISTIHGRQHDKKSTYKVSIEIKITEEDFGDIICTAFEGGIGYWGCLDVSKPEWKDKPKNMPVSEYITKLLLSNKEVTIFDTEIDEDELTEKDVWTLNINKLLSGIKKYLEDCEYDCISEGNIDTCSIDADAADNIIQYALFGKLVFG